MIYKESFKLESRHRAVSFHDITDTVKEIAKRCGFKTIQHFSRKFEEQLGVSPAVFRTQALARRKASF